MPKALLGAAGATVAVGAACFGWGLVEASLYTVRRFDLDILPPGGDLAALCAQHEAETDLTRLTALCRLAVAGNAAAREQALAVAHFDAACRDLLPKRLGIEAAALPFYLGSPLAEALPICGGYKVHADKLKRLGVPIYTSHTVLSANGTDRVESVTIARVDDKFRPIAGSERTFACDTLLIAVGLDSIAEFTAEAKVAGLPVFAAGDAAEIAEASSAMFNGRIAGLTVAGALGAAVAEIPAAWKEKAELLKSHPGQPQPQVFPAGEEGVMPVIHCLQEIPCNPCSTVCPTRSICLEGDPLLGLPRYDGRCIGCGKCVTVCPGLAITLVDYRQDAKNPIVTVPYEMSHLPLAVGSKVAAVDIDGAPLGELEVVAVQQNRENLTRLVRLRAPKGVAKKVVSFRIQAASVSAPLPETVVITDADQQAKVCLCERVSAADVRRLIRQGVTDINQIKAVTRAGMGACGGKSCENLIRMVFRQEGISPDRIVPNTRRPLFVEVPLGTLAGMEKGE